MYIRQEAVHEIKPRTNDTAQDVTPKPGLIWAIEIIFTNDGSHATYNKQRHILRTIE